MAIEDDDKPRKKITHEIGQDLSLLSVEELTERIALMTSEIERLQAGHDEEARVKGCGEQFFQDVDLVHLAGHRPVARMERSAIRERSIGLRPAPDFAEPVIGCAFARPVGSIRVRSRARNESIPKLGHWPTWQIIPEENRSFTKD